MAFCVERFINFYLGVEESKNIPGNGSKATGMPRLLPPTSPSPNPFGGTGWHFNKGDVYQYAAKKVYTPALYSCKKFKY